MAQDDAVPGKHSEIIVNGRKKEVAASSLSYDEVVNLAFDNQPPRGENVIITVTYSKGSHNSNGTLVSGESVEIKSGMVFNVTATDRS
jgi:hypothetical protein